MGLTNSKFYLEQYGFSDVEIDNIAENIDEFEVRAFTTSSKVSMATDENNERGILVDKNFIKGDNLYFLFTETVNNEMITKMISFAELDNDVVSENVNENTYVLARCGLAIKNSSDVYLVLNDRIFKFPFNIVPKYKIILEGEK